MSGLRFVFIFVLSALPFSSWSYVVEQGNVSAIAGPYFYKTNFLNSPNGESSPTRTGIGIIALGDINKSGSLEVAGFYINKLFARNEMAEWVQEQSNLLHITMGYRHHLSERFSVSLTFFSSYTMGEPTTFGTKVASSPSVQTSARDITEYGLDFSLQTELFNHPVFALVLDTRYSASLTSKPNELADQYGVLLGIRYQIQRRQTFSSY